VATPSRICCAGEVMIELAPTGAPGTYLRGVAGDTFNTAVYLARLDCAVSYPTRLGDDPASGEILTRLIAEGIDTTMVQQMSGRQPGIYLIDNDAAGERRFTYWRDASPAREIFDAVPYPGGIDAFYFSGITLAVCRSGLDNLVSLLETLRGGDCTIIFDPNYRPSLWDSREQARHHYRSVLGLCDTVMPTLADEALLWDIDDAISCTRFYRGQGAREVVVKAPDLRIHGFCDEASPVVEAGRVDAVDTTGAGDAFNAAYLAARLQGGHMAQAIAAGHSLAARVVRHRGAIIPRGQMVD
jgi:2-dehydro-3-deoxygluconokinase